MAALRTAKATGSQMSYFEPNRLSNHKRCPEVPPSPGRPATVSLSCSCACNVSQVRSLPGLVDGQHAVVAVVADAAAKKRRCRASRIAGRRTDQVVPAELET